MPTEIRIVDNRTFLLGLDELYRDRMKEHESSELLHCAQVVSKALELAPGDGPVEGYYAESEQLSEYFQRMRALQTVSLSDGGPALELPEYGRLREVSASPLFGTPTSGSTLIPMGMDPLSRALQASFPNWTLQSLTKAAREKAKASDDFSLVGLAAFSGDSLVLAALRETAVLYAWAVAGSAAPEPITFVYEWQVENELAERAARFTATFNSLFAEDLPTPGPGTAERYWLAGQIADIHGRCVRLGYDDSTEPIRHYHWAVAPGAKGLEVREFWNTDLWTTERFSDALAGGERLPFPTHPSG